MGNNTTLGILGVVALFLLLICGVVVPAKLRHDLREEVTKEVMRQLQRSYVPGPYAPGYDPDKVDVGAFPSPQGIQPQGVYQGAPGYKEFR